jgi:hypothetical protein
MVGKPLRLDRVGEYTARRGSWRIIYKLDKRRRVVAVLAVGHRADIYRPSGQPNNPGGAPKRDAIRTAWTNSKTSSA